jgi:hypothetical protein
MESGNVKRRVLSGRKIACRSEPPMKFRRRGRFPQECVKTEDWTDFTGKSTAPEQGAPSKA